MTKATVKQITEAIDQYASLKLQIKALEEQLEPLETTIKEHAKTEKLVGSQLFGTQFSIKIIERHTATYDIHKILTAFKKSKQEKGFYECIRPVMKDVSRFLAKDVIDACQDGETVSVSITNVAPIRG